MNLGKDRWKYVHEPTKFGFKHKEPTVLVSTNVFSDYQILELQSVPIFIKRSLFFRLPRCMFQGQVLSIVTKKKSKLFVAISNKGCGWDDFMLEAKNCTGLEWQEENESIKTTDRNENMKIFSCQTMSGQTIKLPTNTKDLSAAIFIFECKLPNVIKST